MSGLLFRDFSSRLSRLARTAGAFNLVFASSTLNASEVLARLDKRREKSLFYKFQLFEDGPAEKITTGLKVAPRKTFFSPNPSTIVVAIGAPNANKGNITLVLNSTDLAVAKKTLTHSELLNVS